ncbi:FmdB family zinc ribbon protein [Goodfellowiella coeruleoviolacea]|uniref:FmdB family zinc ribbon protein n=1 Tax=Goodfellowiella coeruleoviolacea TaxID=334858 RepID=UPI0020A3AA76|nr:zinc ribbon domain-containing protein [Goodfellowiella coeruleoviolacea]
MPTYEYRCRVCAQTFTANRPMSESAAPARCPGGHEDSVKLLSTIALTGTAGAGRAAPVAAQGGGGGCCGGGCCGG